MGVFGLAAAYGGVHAFLLEPSPRLVLLALRGDVLPEDRLPELERRREPPGWRREVAALIVAVVHARLQEERPPRIVRGKPRRKIRHEGLSVRL